MMDLIRRRQRRIPFVSSSFFFWSSSSSTYYLILVFFLLYHANVPTILPVVSAQGGGRFLRQGFTNQDGGNDFAAEMKLDENDVSSDVAYGMTREMFLIHDQTFTIPRSN
jgi:hypothetical protein